MRREAIVLPKWAGTMPLELGGLREQRKNITDKHHATSRYVRAYVISLPKLTRANDSHNPFL